MSIPFVDLKAQYFSIKEEIDTTIQQVLEGGYFIGGSAVSEFERLFSKYLDVSHCITCGNGTDAIEIALESLGVGNGDEVIVPALSWVSTASSVNRVGAEPVFVDVLADERTIDPDLIKAAITENTKAIIPVHLHGMPAIMTEILEIAKNHNLKVIEDCAQAHGAEINGQKVGTFGDMATFSFYPIKNLGAYGDAGAIVTNDADVAQKCTMLKEYGQKVEDEFEFIGRNSRMDSIQAAILSVKLKHLEEWTMRKIEIADQYSKSLQGVKTPLLRDGYRHVFHQFVIQHPHRKELIQHLKENGIGNLIHYPTPLPFLQVYSYQNHRASDFPVAEKLCLEILSLPIYPEMSGPMITKIIDVTNSLS